MGGVFLELLRDCAVSFSALTLALSRGERGEEGLCKGEGRRGGERFLLLCHSRVGGNPVFAKLMPEGILFGTNIRISDKPLCEGKLDHVYILQ